MRVNLNGVKNGIGTFKYPNGNICEGEWKDDNRHGQGTFTINRWIV